MTFISNTLIVEAVELMKQTGLLPGVITEQMIYYAVVELIRNSDRTV